ncbi:UNKNOWN [Stylonychia lemnae]|uniref:Translation initiation factor 5A C-terminal domain-containing protein n=1 Tax=Stylonychia lemnae TaxID=5949 RepID=A0A078AKY3_STYLE|nr:UNKNOWN [Stylonychia lemnae]|eukprot:CDW81488.1 UNKNOWN [Stylonychia lemnae]
MHKLNSNIVSNNNQEPLIKLDINGNEIKDGWEVIPLSNFGKGTYIFLGSQLCRLNQEHIYMGKSTMIRYKGFNVHTGKNVIDKIDVKYDIIHVPIIKKKIYQVIDIIKEGKDEYLTLMDSDGNIREDFKLFSFQEIDQLIKDLRQILKEDRIECYLTLGQFKDEQEFILDVTEGDQV